MAQKGFFWKTAVLLSGAALAGRGLWQRQQSRARSQKMYQGKVALITGGASGIGRAICLALGARGAMVIVTDIDAAGAEATVAAIHEAGGAADCARLDVRDETAVTQCINDVAEKYGRLDLVFNNAGVGISGDTSLITSEQWRRVLDVNLNGIIYGTTAAYRLMKQQGFGHIVNTGSILGLVPLPHTAPYNTAKHGVVGLSTSLRPEAGQHGVQVSVVCPGFIDTNIFATTEYVSGNRSEALENLKMVKMTSPAACAETILQGVAQNKGIIPVTPLAHSLWALYRLNPNWAEAVTRRFGQKTI